MGSCGVGRRGAVYALRGSRAGRVMYVEGSAPSMRCGRVGVRRTGTMDEMTAAENGGWTWLMTARGMSLS